MQAEDKAWQEYKLSRFEGRALSHEENLMYHQCFIAGYRAAQQSVERMDESQALVLVQPAHSSHKPRER